MARDHETFDYYHSDVIGLDYAVRKDRCPADVVFEDGVVYTEEEIGKMEEADKAVHLFKKQFKGVVV